MDKCILRLNDTKADLNQPFFFSKIYVKRNFPDISVVIFSSDFNFKQRLFPGCGIRAGTGLCFIM